jgi:hypothetical protein
MIDDVFTLTLALSLKDSSEKGFIVTLSAAKGLVVSIERKTSFGKTRFFASLRMTTIRFSRPRGDAILFFGRVLREGES